MKNTNLYNLQNSIAILLAANQYSKAPQLQASPNMERGTDGVWYYTGRGKYLVYNNYKNVPTLVYYTSLGFRHPVQGVVLEYYNPVQFTFPSASDAIECLKTGNYDKGTFINSSVSFFPDKIAPWTYSVSTAIIGNTGTTYNVSTNPYYVYLSSDAYNYQNGNYSIKYVVQTLLSQWEETNGTA